MIFVPAKALAPAFTPKTLTVTFETSDEYYAFHDMLSWNVSVPALVTCNNKIKREHLTKLMNDFRLAMDSIK
jgi:hypothetical protein